MRKRYLILLFLFIFVIISAKKVSAKENIMVTNNENIYLRVLPYAKQNKLSLLYEENNKNIYENNSIKVTEDNIEELYKSWNSNALVVIEDNSIEAKAYGTHLAVLLNAKIEFNFKDEYVNQYKDIYLISDKSITDLPKQVKLLNKEEIKKLYYENTNNTTFDVLIDKNDYYLSGLYIASLRRGRIIFNTEEVRDSSTHFVWATSPSNIDRNSYVNLYSKVNKNNDKSIGIITGESLADAIELVNRGFKYSNIDKSKKITYINKENEKDNQHTKDLEFGMNVYNKDFIKEKDRIYDDLSNSSYIRINGHGNPKGVTFSDKFSIKEFPKLNSSIIVAEACSTVENIPKDGLALDAIKMGAVAFIGSIKNGGTSGFVVEGDSFLISYDDIDLGKLVSFNNYFLMKRIDKVPRSLLIGDPYVYYLDSSILSVTEGNMSFNLPFEVTEEVMFPIKTGSTNYNSGKIRYDNGKSKSILFMKKDAYTFIPVNHSKGIINPINKVISIGTFNYIGKVIRLAYSFFFQEVLEGLLFPCIYIVIFLLFCYKNKNYFYKDKYLVLYVFMVFILFYIIQKYWGISVVSIPKFILYVLILAANYYTKPSFINYVVIDLLLILPIALLILFSGGIRVFLLSLIFIPALTFNFMNFVCKFIRSKFVKKKIYY